MHFVTFNVSECGIVLGHPLWDFYCFVVLCCAVLCAAAFFEILSIEKATVCSNGFTCMSFWVFNNTSFDLFYVVVFFFFLDFVSHLMRRSCTFRQ